MSVKCGIVGNFKHLLNRVIITEIERNTPMNLSWKYCFYLEFIYFFSKLRCEALGDYCN